MALIYEVNIAVDAELAATYEAWLRDHVREVLKNPGFATAQIHTADPDQARACFVIHYQVADRAALEAYFADPGPTGAAALRSDGLTRFGSRMTATRRVLQVLVREPRGFER